MDDMIPRLMEAAERHLDATPIVVAYVFGSRVWGAPREDSDLDVGYCVTRTEASPVLPLSDELALAGRLSHDVGVEVDLRALAVAPLGLRGRVVEQGRRVYCRDEVLRVGFERDTLGRYHDYKAEFEALRALRFSSAASTSPTT